MNALPRIMAAMNYAPLREPQVQIGAWGWAIGDTVAAVRDTAFAISNAVKMNA